MKNWVIYELRDPRSNKRRYIGQTMCLDGRFDQHCANRDYSRNISKWHWIEELKIAGLKPVVNELEAFDDPIQIDEAEQRWIKKSREAGDHLLNMTAGGTSRRTGGLENSTPRDWMELGDKAKLLRELLLEVHADISGLLGKTNPHSNAMKKALSAFEKARQGLDDLVCSHFPGWKDAGKTFSGQNAPELPDE